MARKYSPQDILDMAAGLIETDMAADLDADGKITSWDARYALRDDIGLPPKEPSEESGNGAGNESVGTIMSKDILDKLINRTGSFSYDINGDPIYRQYRDMYKAQGETAAENVFGLAAGLSGGWGNSYGAKVSADVLAEYSKKAENKAQELRDSAKSRFDDETKMLFSLYDILSEREAGEKKSQQEYADNFRELAFKAADIGDYSLLEGLGIDTSALKGDEEWKMAELLAKYSDYSGLEKLGVDLSKLRYDELVDTGKLFAQYGDYTLLKLLGMDSSRKELDTFLEIAKLFAQYGDFSLLEKLGADASGRKEKEKLENLILQNKLKA